MVSEPSERTPLQLLAEALGKRFSEEAREMRRKFSELETRQELEFTRRQQAAEQHIAKLEREIAVLQERLDGIVKPRRVA